MQPNILKSKILSLGLVVLSTISVATTAMESEEQREARVSDLKSRFESPQKQTLIRSQVQGDIMSASPVATRNIASHLSEEAKVRAVKEIEAARLEAQVEIEQIRNGVDSIRVEADLEIKKIHERVELETTKALQLTTELEALKQQKLKLEQELDAAKSDALITRSGIVEKTRTAASYLNPWAYGTTTPQQNSNTETKSTDPS